MNVPILPAAKFIPCRRQNCKASNIGKPSVYFCACFNTGNADFPSKAEQAEEAVAPVNPTDVGAAKRALDTAKKNLKKAKARYGNERNYARYLERINGLESRPLGSGKHDAAQRQPASQDPVAY